MELDKLIQKHKIPKDRQYQLKYTNGTLSQPLSLEEVAKEILDKNLSGKEEVSVYPESKFTHLASDPLFGDLLMLLLEELPEETKQTIRIELKKGKGAIPSTYRIDPRDNLNLEFSFSKSKVSKRISIFLALFVIFILIITFLLKEPSKKSLITEVKREYLSVIIPSDSTETPNPSLSKSLYEKALENYSKDTVRAHKEAIDLLQEALKVFPQDVSSLSLLAKCYLNLTELSKKDTKFFSDVFTLIERAERMDPPVKPGDDRKGIEEAKALWHARQNNLLEASSIIEEVIKNNPSNSDAHLILGEIAYLQGDDSKAISSLEKTLELNPSLIRAHYLLGKTYLKKNDPEKAYEIFMTGLNLYPEHALSRLEASLIEIQTFNKLLEAQGNLKIVIQFPSLLAPSDLARAHYHLGWTYEEEKQFDFAIKEYKKAFELEPQNHIYTAAYEKLQGQPGVLSDTADSVIHEESLYFTNIGNRYLEENKLIDAIAQYKAALQIDAKNHLAYFQLGKVFEKQKKWKEALIYYNKALETKSTSIDPYAAIAKIHLHYFDYDKALSYIEKIKTIQPKSAVIYNLSGLYYAQKGDLEKALSEYKKAGELDPDNFEAHFEAALLFRSQKDFRRSEKYFFKALKIKPDEASIQTEVAFLYFEQGLKSQAIEHLKKLSSAYPLNGHYLAGLGKLYFLAGDHSLAKETYTQALQKEEHNLDALEGLAMTFDHLNRPKEALDMYKKIIRIDPSNAKWYFERGKIQFKAGNIQQALSEFKLTSQMNDRYPLIHFSLGKLYLLLEKYPLAEEEFKKEIKTNTHIKDPHFALGKLFEQQDRFEEAQEHYKQYIQRDPAYADAYIRLGRIHQKLNRFETAIEFFKTALNKEPDLAEAYLQLGITYQHLERRSDAIEAFENYLRISPDAQNIHEVKKIIEELKY